MLTGSQPREHAFVLLVIKFSARLPNAVSLDAARQAPDGACKSANQTSKLALIELTIGYTRTPMKSARWSYGPTFHEAEGPVWKAQRGEETSHKRQRSGDDPR